MVYAYKSLHSNSIESCYSSEEKNKVNLQPLFSMLLHTAKVTLTLPVSNAWQERAETAMKVVNTRYRSSLQNMLGRLWMVLIVSPSVKDCGPVVKFAIKMWPENKKRKKVPRVKVKRLLFQGHFLVCSTETWDATRHNHSGTTSCIYLRSFCFCSWWTGRSRGSGWKATILDLPPCSPDSIREWQCKW